MSCNTCGSNTNCGCASQGTGRVCSTSCACGNPTCCGTCGCGTPLPGTPLPFYACAPACPENHKQTLVRQQFYFDITAQNTWNVPECGENATLSVPGLKSINVGSYIWNLGYGYFEIVSFDVSTGQIVIVNNCNEGNAAAGTNVPACTLFTVTVPPCECPEDSDICVAIDFTAPDVGNCIDITLTTTQGVTASDTVEIGTGQYFVDAIKPNDIITICNQGFGITPGTPVIAKDVNDNYQYCLQIISTNPCDREEESEGPLIICNGNDVQGPLECTTTGWVPTALGGDESDVSCRPIGSTTCASLDGQLNLINGDATYAAVPVTDSTGFGIGDTIEFAGSAGWTALITGIPDGTHINITISPTPSFNTSIPDETLFCLENCCDTFQSLFDQMFLADTDSFLDDTLHTLNAGTPSFTTPIQSIVIANPHPTRSMNVHMIFQAKLGARYLAVDDFYVKASLVLDYDVNGGVLQSPVTTYEATLVAFPDDFTDISTENNTSRVDVIPPLTTYTYNLNARVIWVGYAANALETDTILFSYSYITTPAS